MKVLIGTAVYNEGERPLSQIRNFPATLPIEAEWLIVDDGSTDNTVELIKNATKTFPVKVTILHNGTNHGVGYSLKRIIHYAIDNGYDLIMNTAGNGKDDLRQIPIILKPLMDGSLDYVTGSRFLTGGSYQNLPLPRKLMMKAYTVVWNLRTGKRLTDITNGFRGYTTKLFSDPRINIDQEWLDRYELEYYLYYKVLTLGYRSGEVPVSKDYPVQSKKKRVKYSKIRPFVDWWKMIRPLVYLTLGIKK